MTDDSRTFKRREVERSFRKFRDLASDLLRAPFQTWGDVFTRLITHCEHDPVMQVITGPLKTDPRVDAMQWWTGAVKSVRGMVGSGTYTLPADDDERTALLYQAFLALEYDKVSLKEFCIAVWGLSRFQDMVDTFNRELVQKFTREVMYRLQDIETDTAGIGEIRSDAMVVFHHHDYSTSISGTIHGSNIAVGQGRIENSTAQFDASPDLAAELRSLKSLVGELSRVNQRTVADALEYLAAIAESGQGEAAEIAECARTISEISEPVRSRLARVVDGAAGSLVGSALVEGLRIGLGMVGS